MNIKTNHKSIEKFLFPNNLLTIKEASIWATNYLGKNVTISNTNGGAYSR